MGKEKLIQFESSDGCIYMFNTELGKWRKVCDIVIPQEELPPDVLKHIRGLSNSIKHHHERRGETA